MMADSNPHPERGHLGSDMILMEQIKYSIAKLLNQLPFQVARAEPELDEEAWAVKVNCVGGTMTITVSTKEPFYGVVHGRNRSEPGCSVQGSGGLKTRLKVDLSVPEGSPGNCGVRYNPVRLGHAIIFYFNKCFPEHGGEDDRRGS